MKHIQNFENFIKESVINETTTVKSFFFSKKEKDFTGDVDGIRKEAANFLKYLKGEKYLTGGSFFLYFPDFRWAGGKQAFGPSIGFLVGSDTIVIRPIGTSKTLKVQDELMSLLIKKGTIESYSVGLSTNEGVLANQWQTNNKKGFTLKNGNFTLVSDGPGGTHKILKGSKKIGTFGYDSNADDFSVELDNNKKFFANDIDDIFVELEKNS